MPIDNTLPGFKFLSLEHFDLAEKYFTTHPFDHKCSRKELHKLNIDNSFIIDRSSNQIFALEDTHTQRDASTDKALSLDLTDDDEVKPPNYLGQGASARVKYAQTFEGTLYALRIAQEMTTLPMMSEAILRDLKKLQAVIVRPSFTTKTFFTRKRNALKPLEKRYQLLKLEHGDTFFDFMTPHYEGRPFSMEDRLKLTLEIMKELKILHEKDIIHRDIKPDNIIITKKEDGYVISFVDFQDAVYACSARKTFSQKELVGTPSYLAPELNSRKVLRFQRGLRFYSPASDIFALGIILTGGTIFKPTPSIDILYPQEYIDSSGLFSRLEMEDYLELRTIFAPMLTIDPKTRSSINHLIHLLEQYMMTRYPTPIVASPPPFQISRLDALSIETPPLLTPSPDMTDTLQRFSLDGQ